MTKYNKRFNMLIYFYITLLIFISLTAIIPASGAIDQRGPLISIAAKEHIILNGENCPGFYYSTSSGTYYESLDLYFSEDGLIDTGNAMYTSKITSGSTAFFGKKYKVLEDGLLSESLISYGSRDLQQGNDFDLGNTIRYDKNFIPENEIKPSSESIEQDEYALPSLTLLKDYKAKPKDQNKQQKNSLKLEETLMLYGIEATLLGSALLLETQPVHDMLVPPISGQFR